MITFEDWRTKKWRIFIEVASVREYYTQNGYQLWRSKELTPHSCYYLGQYPWYWDLYLSRPVSPFGATPIPVQTEAVKKRLALPGSVYPTTAKYSPSLTVFGVPVSEARIVRTPIRVVNPFAMAQSYPDVNWDAYKNQPEEDNRFFLGDHVIETWNEQTAVIEYMNRRFKNCMAQNYPRT